MTVIKYVTKKKGPKGRRIVSYGYRLWLGGQLHNQMVSSTEELARETEKGERFTGREAP